MNCVELFLRSAKERQNHTSIVHDGDAVSYEDLAQRIQRAAGRLSAMGVGPGDRIVILVPMSVDLYAWVIGVLYLGGTVLFVEPWMPLEQLTNVLARAKPRALLASPLGALLAQRSPAFRDLRPKWATRFGRVLSLFGWKPMVETGPETALHPAGDDDIAVLTFTTGSSGNPKAVVRTHGLLAAQHRVLSASLRLTEDDICLHGFANFVLNNLAVGATSIIPPIKPAKPTVFSPRRMTQLVESSGVTSIIVPPPTLDKLVEFARENSMVLPSVRSVATGGGPVPRDLLQRAAPVFPNADPEVVYGSSEAEPVTHIGWSELREVQGRGVCVGRPVDAVSVQLIADGEIAVSGPHVSRGYLDDPEAIARTKFTDADGILWHRMGDVGEMDEEGRLWLTGRLHNIIRTEEGPVLPLPLERAAEELEAVAAAGVVGMGEPGQAKVVLALELEKNQTLDPLTLQESHPELDQVVIVDSIPRDRRHQAKTDYAQLADVVKERLSRV